MFVPEMAGITRRIFLASFIVKLYVQWFDDSFFNSYPQIYGIKLSWYGTVDLLRLFGAVLYFSLHRDAIVVCAYDGFAYSSFFFVGIRIHTFSFQKVIP